MEKPAVIFSESGWKAFLKFLGEEKEDNSGVDAFVSQYRAHKNNDGYDEWLSEVTEVVTAYLMEHTNASSTELATVLRQDGHDIDYAKRGMVAVMNNAMELNECVVKTGPRTYRYEERELHE